jgi:hypothetical protein
MGLKGAGAGVEWGGPGGCAVQRQPGWRKEKDERMRDG